MPASDKFKLKILTLLLFLIVFPLGLTSETIKVSADELIYTGEESIGSDLISRYYLDETRADEIFSGQNELLIRDFPLNSSLEILELTRAGCVIDANTVFLKSGMFQSKTDHPRVNTFKGTISGLPGSRVVLSYIDGLLIGSIIYPDGKTYNIGPSPDGISRNEIIIADNSLFSFPKFNIDDSPDFMELKKSISDNDAILSDELLEMELAVETDTEFFKATGSDYHLARTYLLALMSNVTLIYEEYLNITIYLKWVNIWTDDPADPYDAKGDFAILRDRSVDYWEQNRQDVERDVFHVMTSISYGGGGYGYFDALCGNKKYGMSVSSVQGWNSLPTFNFSYDVYIVGHELGHNLNAQHTHSCFWNNAPLDTCVVDKKCLDEDQEPLPSPGSIMSYCGGTNNQAGLGYYVNMVFRQENVEIMRQTAEDAECVEPPENPRIILISQDNSEEYHYNDAIEINWISSKVNAVKIEYSYEPGIWTSIVDNISAAEEEYRWTAPEICSKDVLIRISDINDQSVADTSLMPLTIITEDPTGLVAHYPLNGNTNDEQFCHFYDAENNNEVEFTTDRFDSLDRACQFNGANYLVSKSFKAAFEELTVSLWFNADNLSGKSNLIGTDFNQGWVFSAYYWGQLGISLYIDGKGVPDQIWAGSLQSGQWYHLAFTFDGRKAVIYLNGKLKAEKDFGTDVSLNQFPRTPLYIGSRSENDYFTGKIDDVRIYKSALFDDDIKDIYENSGNLPDVPLLMSPANNTSDLDSIVQLEWLTVRNANYYHLQVSKEYTFNQSDIVLVDPKVNKSQYKLTGLQPNNRYFWHVAAVNENGSSDWSVPLYFNTGSFVSVEEASIDKISFELFPNPATEKVAVRIMGDANQEYTATICDMIGRCLKSVSLMNLYNEIDLSGMSKGVYYFRLSDGQQTVTRKLVVY